MHPVKERILRYEAKYGFNLEARRAFNRAIRGGVNPWQWVKGFFHRSKKTRSKKTQQPHHVSRLTQVPGNTSVSIKAYSTPTKKYGSAQTVPPLSTPSSKDGSSQTVQPFSTLRHSESDTPTIQPSNTKIRKRKRHESPPKQTSRPQYGLRHALDQRRKYKQKSGLKHAIQQSTKHGRKSGLRHVLLQRRSRFNTKKPKKTPSRKMTSPTRIASSSSATTTTSKATYTPRHVPVSMSHKSTPKATHRDHHVPVSKPRTSTSSTPHDPHHIPIPMPRKPPKTTHKTTTSTISVWYEGKQGYQLGSTSERLINKIDRTITIDFPDNLTRDTSLNRVTFHDPQRFQHAYDVLKEYGGSPQNLSNLNYYFKEHEHGGGGDCFLYAWMGSSKEQNNNTEYDDRVKDLLQTCPQWNTIQRYEQEVARGIIHRNKPILQKRIKQAEMRCLREVVGNFMRVELERRSDRLQPRDKKYMENVIQRITTRGTWLQDEDIIKIADYMNMRFFVFIEATNTWQIYEPPTDPEGIYVPTYYIINKGLSNNGWAGFHYKSLTKLYKGNFDSP